MEYFVYYCITMANTPSIPKNMKKDTTYVQDLAVSYQDNPTAKTFGEIYKNVAPGLAHYIRKIVKDDEHTNDIVSEAFINAQQKITMFNPEFRFTTWIYKIAYNIAVYQLRTKGKRKSYTFDTSFASTDDSGSMYESWLLNHATVPVSTNLDIDMDNEFDENATDNLFFAAMDKIADLDDFDRTILMNSLNGMDHQTQADEYGMTYSTMRNAVFRARHAVKDQLEGTLEETAWRHFNNVTQDSRTDFELGSRLK